MEEARRILVDPHARLQKHRIIGAGQLEDSLLVRNARRHDPHIHPPFGRKAQSCLHLVIHDQVGREDIHIILRAIQDVQVHIFTQALVVQGRIAVGLDKALTLEGFRMPHMGSESFIGFVRMPVGVPHPQKHDRIIPDCLALQHKARVLPVPKAHLFIDVLVRQVHAAAESCMTVDNRYLPMIAVIHY